MLLPLQSPCPSEDSSSQPIKIMIIGDSISHGREGDHTWRYRLFSWLQSQSVPFQFVGPYEGTVPPDEPHPPRPPPLIGESPLPPEPLRTNGGYANSVSESFLVNSDHFAGSGRHIYECKSLVAEQISLYKPDLCLVQLGFNDLAWLRSSPSTTLQHMKALIDNARLVKPDVKFAVANVPHRTDIPGQEWLGLNTDIYNALMARRLPSWETRKSEVRLVRLCDNYSCGGRDSRGAYDGLHPNSRGEWEIAQAFSRTMVKEFGIGRDEIELPERIEERRLDVPRGVEAFSAPCGVVVEWEKVYGAHGYEIETLGKPGVRCLSVNKLYETGCLDGEVCRYRVRACYGDKVRSGWTEVVEGVARPETAPPPGNIRLWAREEGFEIELDRPEGEFARDIDRYGVVVYDYCLPDNYPGYHGVKGERGEINGLKKGHRYAVSVRTWNKAGEGMPGICEREVVVGRVGRVQIPRGLRVMVLSSGGVELVWPVDYDVGGYEVWGLNEAEGRQECIFKCPVDGYECGKRIVYWLEPSLRAWQFAIKAYNGNRESNLSVWVPVPGTDPKLETSPISLSLETHDTIAIGITHS
ncbi:receptor-type tyrosine-protein phosphatase F [Cladorrhinum sp. PSN259]|nr:receptor-type tyrosine-protein phosphatase F [Cladorrhinum sp. PSN259]